MKSVLGCLLVVSVVVSSCQKEVVPAYAREKPHAAATSDSDVRISARLTDDDLIRPFPRIPIPRPDTLRRPVLPKLPRIPLQEPVLTEHCIYSYDELVNVLGTNKAQAKAVILDGGALGDITLERSDNLPWIYYTAVPEATGSSLFRSQLQVEWRPDPSVFFSGFRADVWSAGCLYNYPSLGAFTNLLKGGVEIGINTCIFWGVGEYAHLRIKHIVLD